MVDDLKIGEVNLPPPPVNKGLKIFCFQVNVIEETIGMACPCGLPDVMENMIGCDGIDCGKWFHESCTGLDVEDISSSWICKDCSKKLMESIENAI